MSYNHYVPGKTNPHLPHDGLEMKRIPASAEEIELARSDADDLVRQLMDGGLEMSASKPEPAPQARAVPQKGRPGARPITRPLSQPANVHPLFRGAEPVGAPAAAEPDKPVELRDEALVQKMLKEAFPPLKEQAPAVPDRGPHSGMAQDITRAVLGGIGLYMGAALAAVILFFRPMLVLGLVLLAVGLIVAAVLALKLPVLSRLLHKGWARFAKRAPKRAERLRIAADATAGVIEQVLDYLPGGLADRLALPDFSKPLPPKG